jgi:Spy/CpxP family protein refolding chaperone
VGERLIEQETKLDRLFAGRSVTPATLRIVTEEIGATQGRLREAHLKYHLAMLELLTPAQVRRYRELRGYGSHRHHGQH